MTSAFRSSLGVLAFGFFVVTGTGCSSSSNNGNPAPVDDAGTEADTGSEPDAGGFVDSGTPNPALRDPTLATDTAPDVFQAKFVTTKGDFVLEVTRAWAPLGADRFYNLVKIGYFNEERFFRVVSGFVVQWGISGVPAINAKWNSANIDDDPVIQSNTEGFITYAKTSQPNSRSTQVFINLANNAGLDAQGFAPFGKVVDGMDVVKNLYSGYGDDHGPDQTKIQSQGNTYLNASFPKLDWIKEATIVQ